jgi:hypothetical protein
MQVIHDSLTFASFIAYRLQIRTLIRICSPLTHLLAGFVFFQRDPVCLCNTISASTMEGYPQISQLMYQHPELAIMRKFGNLNMLNMLHMQAELMHLEERYYKLSKTDEECSSRAYRSRDWWSLTRLDCDGKREQWDALCEIREKLREYSISSSHLK